MKKLPHLKSDEEAEAFLDQDLSDLDFSQFKPVTFEFEHKDARVNMRWPASLLNAVKARAAELDMPYQRYIRSIVERDIHVPR